MHALPKTKHQRLIYAWYVFAMKTGSVERSIGTRLEENGECQEVYDQHLLTLSVQKSDVLDHWQQERRVTKAGEQRVKEALLRIATARS
jgi:hypothetical protein